MFMENKNYNNKNRTKHILRNINIFITILVTVFNVLIFIFLRNNKNIFVISSSFICICLFFLYSFLMQIFLKNNLNEIKKEALYINHILNLVRFFFVFVLILFASTITLFILNHEIFSITFIFMFYVSIISMILPSLLLLSFIYFIVPAFIIPGIQSNRKDDSFAQTILSAALIIFFIFSLFQYVKYTTKAKNITKQQRYKVSSLQIKYSTNFLKLGDITPYGKKKLSQSEFTVPIAYTQEQININNYDEAENFCESINARIPNYLEMYNIAFNNFDTFGENYYWTSNEDNRIPLVIHFKNMSYTLEKYQKDQNPKVYCIASKKDYKEIESIHYFINDIATTNADMKRDIKNNDDIGVFSNKNKDDKLNNNDINSDKKHINFSIREVNTQIMQQLLQKGYYYDTELKINSKYETTDREVQNRIIRDKNRKQIRLCYYPFTDYGTMNLNEEAQVWSQSFCSPSFEVIRDYPEKKSEKEMNSYCASLGGRLPNVPELTAIINSLSISGINISYWTNNRVTQSSSGVEYPVIATVVNSRYLKLSMVPSNTNAYAYCIKNSSQRSKVIANYKSRFRNLDGTSYAKALCSDCLYYEVPDTIIQSY